MEEFPTVLEKGILKSFFQYEDKNDEITIYNNSDFIFFTFYTMYSLLYISKCYFK